MVEHDEEDLMCVPDGIPFEHIKWKATEGIKREEEERVEPLTEKDVAFAMHVAQEHPAIQLGCVLDAPSEVEKECMKKLKTPYNRLRRTANHKDGWQEFDIEVHQLLVRLQHEWPVMVSNAKFNSSRIHGHPGGKTRKKVQITCATILMMCMVAAIGVNASFSIMSYGTPLPLPLNYSCATASSLVHELSAADSSMTFESSFAR